VLAYHGRLPTVKGPPAPLPDAGSCQPVPGLSYLDGLTALAGEILELLQRAEDPA
jgi:hypothetical protein